MQPTSKLGILATAHAVEVAGEIDWGTKGVSERI